MEVAETLRPQLVACWIGSNDALGAVLAYAVASGNPDGLIRRLYLAGSGVLAQFGGVTLAFAFLATMLDHQAVLVAQQNHIAGGPNNFVEMVEFRPRHFYEL